MDALDLTFQNLRRFGWLDKGLFQRMNERIKNGHLSSLCLCPSRTLLWKAECTDRPTRTYYTQVYVRYTLVQVTYPSTKTVFLRKGSIATLLYIYQSSIIKSSTMVDRKRPPSFGTINMIN